MCRHILAAGLSLIVFDPDRSAVEDVVAAGARLAESAGEVASSSDVVIVMAGFFDQVSDAVVGPQGVLTQAAEGSILVVSSTLTPDQVVELAKACAARGVHLLDAPVCQGERGAVDGRLVWFVGGESHVLERARPALQACGPEIFHLGDVGAGMATKALNNMLLWAALVADHEAMALASSYGLDRDHLIRALRRSSGANWALEQWHEIHSIPWAHKDMRIILEMADRSGVTLPLAGLLREQVKPLMHYYGMTTDLAR
jgi:3-hydroxyisobutyrate dehydrogenase-like beta-hydroxyacid dehydrogenase